MSRLPRLWLLASAGVFLSMAGAWGQPVSMPACAPETPYFCMDAACFLGDGMPLLEVYVEICNDALQFVKTDDGYRASADLTAVIYDDSGRQVAGDTYRVRLHSTRYDGTTAVDTCKTLTMTFGAPTGEYELAVTVADRDSRRKSVVSAQFRVSDFLASPSLSDIAFVTHGKGGGSSRWPGFGPNVRRSYGDIADGVAYYYEVYNAGKGDSLKIESAVLDQEGLVVYSDTSLVEAAGGTGQYGRVPLDSLSNGRYSLELRLLDAAGVEEASRSSAFEVSREEFYLGKDVKDAVALLTYIASSSFINSFADADVDERKRMWERFWREKDPTPATPRNEFYEEHLRRFKYATRNYAAGVTEGWRTDRGRIYIVEGPPDEIESYPMEIDRNPTEIWFYFATGRRYVFVDETGFGDYVLVSIR